jgi:hypothetical protein
MQMKFEGFWNCWNGKANLSSDIAKAKLCAKILSFPEKFAEELHLLPISFS